MMMDENGGAHDETRDAITSLGMSVAQSYTDLLSSLVDILPPSATRDAALADLRSSMHHAMAALYRNDRD